MSRGYRLFLIKQTKTITNQESNNNSLYSALWEHILAKSIHLKQHNDSHNIYISETINKMEQGYIPCQQSALEQNQFQMRLK